MKKIGEWTCVILTLIALSGSYAWSAGLWLYEAGTPDMGTAAAGRAAMADDASTAGSNPAGMTRLERSQMLIGVQPLYLNSEFSPGSETTVSGSDGGNAGGWVMAGKSFVRTQVQRKFKFRRYGGLVFRARTGSGRQLGRPLLCHGSRVYHFRGQSGRGIQNQRPFFHRRGSQRRLRRTDAESRRQQRSGQNPPTAVSNWKTTTWDTARTWVFFTKFPKTLVSDSPIARKSRSSSKTSPSWRDWDLC